MSAPESYAHIHRGVQAVLEGCGLSARLTPEASALESEACFQKPVRFDIVDGGLKLAGAAQRRTREGLLHQGSILLPDPARNGEVREAFGRLFSARLGLDFSPGELTAAEAARAAGLERGRYADEAWNRMR